EPREARFAKSCEAIAIMRALWTEPSVDFAGSFYTLADARLAPKPGPIPIWFGGFSDQLLSAIVRYGDGWILGTNPDPAFVAARWDRLRELCREAGRDPDEIAVAVPLMAHLSRDRERAQASLDGYIARGDFGRWLGDFFGENARAFGLWGTPDDAFPKLKPYLDLGVRDFIFDLRPPGIALETAELLASEILPRLTSS
ncbi:MAG: LLM class flavin-dependent oxidoreductase, partial [Rhizobiales bacterium]|nr:LLM class flavin-dependent oxidoreductase [Hyphomicrobiales bacterium]